MQIENKAVNCLFHIILTIMAIICIFPVILVISISFTEQAAISKFGYQIIPSVFSLDAYKFIINANMGIGNAYIVTIFATVIGTILSVSVISLYAYPLSRPGLKGKGFFTFYIFFTMLFSGGLIAWYMTATKILHLSNKFLALVLPLSMNAWYVIIMRTFFQSSIPVSLIESAKLDGAGEFTILFKIVLPLAVPGIATISLFQTLAYWNDWWYPMLLITEPKLYNLQFLLQVMMKNIQLMSEGNLSPEFIEQMGGNIPEESVRMALCVLAMGPILVVYPFFQKYFIQGLTVGAVKG